MSLTLLKNVNLHDLAVLDSSQLTVSIYLPLDRANPEANRINLKNVLSKTKTLLKEKSDDSQDTDALLSELAKLSEHEIFAQSLYPGIGVLASLDKPNDLTIHPLTSPPTAQANVGDKPVLTPLIQSQGHQRVTLLCLADNGLRLLRGHLGALHEEVLGDDFPQDLKEVIRFEESAGLDGNEHYRNRTSSPGAGSPHGEGPTNRVEGEFERRYFREIGKALADHLTAGEKLLLAGVHEKVALFRAENSELPLLDEEIHGNFEGVPTPKLLQLANDELRALNQKTLSQEISAANELPPERRSSKPEELHEAAVAGRVDTLYLNGSLQDITRLEPIALEVLKTGGSVTVVDLPDSKMEILGTLRW